MAFCGIALGLGATGVILVYAVIFAKRRWSHKVYPRDVVILHQIGRGPWAPSLSPFPIKLETFLRWAKIPHQVEHGYQMSSKGKTPWITYNGVEVADSQFCIEYITAEFKVHLDDHLTAAEKAIARAFQKLVEEDLYWTIALWRWVYNKDTTFLYENAFMKQVPLRLMQIFSRTIASEAKSHGKGRHSEAEVIASADESMRALSTWLEDKDFFMGDKPSEVDCAIFGMLAQCLWHMPGSPHEKLMKGEEMPNLSKYCLRMKERFWPDWDDIITHGGTRDNLRA